MIEMLRQLFGWWVGGQSPRSLFRRGRVAKARSSYRPEVDEMEDRQLLSATSLVPLEQVSLNFSKTKVSVQPTTAQTSQVTVSTEGQSSNTPATSMPTGQVEMFVRLRRIVW
jgi:hypothetical protein